MTGKKTIITEKAIQDFEFSIQESEQPVYQVPPVAAKAWNRPRDVQKDRREASPKGIMTSEIFDLKHTGSLRSAPWKPH